MRPPLQESSLTGNFLAGGYDRASMIRKTTCRLLLAAVAVGQRPDYTAAAPVRLVVQPGETALLLGIDDHLLPLRSNLALYLSKPDVLAKPVLTPDRTKPRAPDFLASNFYGTVLHDEGKFRMWYYGLHYLSKPSELHPGPVCYAESRDGISWTKPNLGQTEIKGSRDNNAIRLPDDETWFAGVIKEENDPDPNRRYKMIYDTKTESAMPFRTATSPDGLHWTASPGYAIESFIELSSFYKHNGLYVANGQYFPASEGGRPSGRQGGAVVSPNFDDWIPAYANSFLIQEPADPSQRGGSGVYDQVHLGVGGARFGNVVVGLFGRWHNRPGDATRDIPAAWFGFSQTSCDLSLVISNDGIHFREPAKGHIFLSREDSLVTPIEGQDIPTILCQSGNGILNVGDKTFIYHGRWRNAKYGLNYWAEIALATLPRDRWGAIALASGADHGTLWSAPIQLPDSGAKISLNADGARGLRVDVADEQFSLLPEYSGAGGGQVRVDGGLQCAVDWHGEPFTMLKGKTVRLRFRFSRENGVNPQLFAVYLQPKNPARRLSNKADDSRRESKSP